MFQLAKLTLTWPCSRRNMMLIPSVVSLFLSCRSVYQLAHNRLCLMDALFFFFFLQFSLIKIWFMTKLLSSLRHQSSSHSSSHWGRWPTCPCPAFRPGVRSGFLTWLQEILFISCPWRSLEPCSSSWRWEFFYPTSEQHLCPIFFGK